MTDFDISTLNWIILAPQFSLVVTAVFVLILDFWGNKIERINMTLIALIGLATAFVLLQYKTVSDEFSFSGMVISDGISLYLEQLFIVGAGFIVLLGHPYAMRHRIAYAEYLALLLFSTVGMMVVSVSVDLVPMFVGIELLSLCLYVLTGMRKQSLSSGEASLKYFVLGAFSTGFLVYGIAFVFGLCQTTNLAEIGSFLIDDAASQGTPLLMLGFAFILVGLGFKISLVPFHMWAPDVYQGAPTPITAWIATGSKIAGFAALLRIFSLPDFSFAPLSNLWIHGIWWLAMLTMIIGNAGALVQFDIKRMLAYSSIAHGGYLAMAFVADNAIGQQAMLFYLAAYLFMSAGAFGVVAALSRNGRECLSLSDFAGLSRQYPYLAGLMTLCLFSLAGMPMTAGFWGKLWLFGAAIQSSEYVLATVGILTTLFSFYYYLRVMVYMWMYEADDEQPFDRVPVSNVIAVSLASAGVFVLGIFPNLIWKMIVDGIHRV